MKLKELLALFVLAALWGASFLFMRIASPVLGPFLTIQGRVAIAAAVLLLYLFFIRRRAELRKRWRQYLIIGALNAAIPFTLIASSELYLNASMAAILNSMTPLFTALVVWGWMKEKMSIRKWLGIFLGIAGVVILVGWSQISFTPAVLLAILFSILSTIFYGFGGVYAKVAFKGVPALSLAVGQQIGATVFLLPFTIFNLPASTISVTPVVIYSVLGLALFCTAIAYLIYFYLIANVGPTKASTVTFLVPIFGMIWGTIFLGENITAGMIAGLLVIFSSIFLISDIKIHSTTQKKKRIA